VLVASAWWGFFSIPVVLFVRDRPPVASASAAGATARGTIRVLRDAIAEARRRPDLGRFLVAYLIFNDGVQTVLLMASIFGAKALGMSSAAIAACYLMIQFVAFAGALVAGRLADRAGHKPVIVTTLILLCRRPPSRPATS
jgi:UMF1 family MFS transporter